MSRKFSLIIATVILLCVAGMAKGNIFSKALKNPFSKKLVPVSSESVEAKTLCVTKGVSIQTAATMTICATIYASQLTKITKDNGQIELISTPTTTSASQISSNTPSPSTIYTIGEGTRREEASTTSTSSLNTGKNQVAKQEKGFSEERAGKGVTSTSKATSTVVKK